MELNPDLKNALWAVLGAVAATAIAAVPSAWKGLKKDIGDEALHRDAELKMAKELGTQSQRITDLAKDLNGVADMVREQFRKRDERLEKRFAKLSEKDAVLAALVTQELPKFEDTDERPSGEQLAVTNA